MPAKSEAQQRLMGMALASKRGEKGYSGKVKETADSMSEKQLRDFAKTKHEGLPEKKAMHNTVRSTPPYEGNLHSKAPIRDLGHPIANTAAELFFGKNLIPDRLEGEDMVDALNRRNRSIDFKSTAANNLANHPIFQGLGIGGSKGAKILGNIDAFSGGKISDKLSPILGGSTYKATEDIHNMMHNPGAMSAFGAGTHSGEGVMKALGKNFYKHGSLLDGLKNRLFKKAEPQIAGNYINQHLGELPSTDSPKSMTYSPVEQIKQNGATSMKKEQFAGTTPDQKPVNNPSRSADKGVPRQGHKATFSKIPMNSMPAPMSKMSQDTAASQAPNIAPSTSPVSSAVPKLMGNVTPAPRVKPFSNPEIASEAAAINANPGGKPIGAVVDNQKNITNRKLKTVPSAAGIPNIQPSNPTRIAGPQHQPRESTVANTHTAAGNMIGALGKRRTNALNAVTDFEAGDISSTTIDAASLLKNPKINMVGRAIEAGKRFMGGDTAGGLLEAAGGVIPIVPDAINAVRDFNEEINTKAERNRQFESRNREVRGSLQARNTGISNVDGETYVNSGDAELLGKLGFDLSESEYEMLEKTSEVLDLYSYIEKIAGVPKEVAKLIDSGKAFSAEYLKEMGYNIPKGYEVKGDLCCPSEKTEKTAAADPAQTILITGHSGSGKTTLSRQLAEKLGIPVRRVDAHRGWDNYIRGDDKRWKETLTPGTKEHSYFTNLVNRATRDTLKNAPTAGIIEGTQLGHLSPEELAKFKAHIVAGGTRDQSIAQRIQRSVDKASKSGVTFSPEEMDTKRIKAKYVADFWEPGVEKFRKLPGVINYNHTEHQVDPLVEQLRALMSKESIEKTAARIDKFLRSLPAGEKLVNTFADQARKIHGIHPGLFYRDITPEKAVQQLREMRKFIPNKESLIPYGSTDYKNAWRDIKNNNLVHLEHGTDRVAAENIKKYGPANIPIKDPQLTEDMRNLRRGYRRERPLDMPGGLEMLYDKNSLFANPQGTHRTLDYARGSNGANGRNPSALRFSLPASMVHNEPFTEYRIGRELFNRFARNKRVEPISEALMVPKIKQVPGNSNIKAGNYVEKPEDAALTKAAEQEGHDGLLDQLKKHKFLAAAGGVALGGLKAFGGHKLIDAGLSNLVRRSGIAENYYSNAARAGFNAGITKQDVLPRFRRALGTLSPTLTGLADYEIARGLSKELLKSKRFKDFKGSNVEDMLTHIKATKRLEGANLDPVIQHLTDHLSSSAQSPLTKHLTRGFADQDLKKNRLIEWFKSQGTGSAKNENMGGMTVGLPAAITSAIGYLTHGPGGALGALAASSLSDVALAKATSRDSVYKTVNRLKQGITGEGILRGMDKAQDSSFGTKLKQTALGLFQPTSGEIYEMGRDVGRSANTGLSLASNVTNIAKSQLPTGAKVPQHIQKAVDGVGARTEKYRDKITGYVNKNMIEPARDYGLGKLLIKAPTAKNAPDKIVKTAAADHPLVSSNIKAVGYDKKEKELEVAFHSGGEYKYRDVPRGLYARLLKVKSPGKFFHKHIKKNNKFEFEKKDTSTKK
jgi:cytidylate kinase